MNKTILIVIGIACAVISAAGIIQYNSIVVARHQLIHPSPRIRENGIWTLDIKKDKQSSLKIQRLLNDEYSGVIIAAMTCLSDFNYKESIPEIRKLLDSKNPSVRSTSLNAKRKLIDREPLNEEIRDCIVCANGNALIRGTAIKSLAELGDKESIPKIKELLKDEDAWVTYEAEYALKLLGVPESEIEKAKQK